jgi:uncharacterized protein (TIGR02597 family)
MTGSSLLLKSFRTSVFSGVAALTLATASAQTAYTVPEGYVTVAIQPGNGSVGTFNFICLPLQSPTNLGGQLQSRLTGVTSNTLSNSNGGWTSSAFAAAGSPFFVKINSGTASGRIFQITANTATQLTVDNQGLDLTTLGIATGSSGDGYEIFPGDTLLSAFGTPTEGVVGGTDPNGAVDRVMLMNNGVWDTYYYNTTASQWRKGALPFNQSNTVIRPDVGLIFSRVGTAPLSYTFLGRVPNTNLKKVLLSDGFSTVASYFPVAQTLNSLNFQAVAGWKKIGDSGITVANADKVYLNETGVWDAYHYDNTVSQWRKGALPFNQNNKSIPVGSGLLINRSGGPANSGTDITRPYSLN